MGNSYKNQSFSRKTILKMNTSLNITNTSTQMTDYCVLSSQHSHSFPSPINLLTNDTNLLLLDKDKEDSILALLANNNQDKNELGSGNFQNNSLALYKSASGFKSSATEQQPLDPYIDAVQVKSRINNKRGPRVKALPSPRGAYLPSSSYQTTKSIQVVKEVAKTGHYDEYGDSTDDDSDGDDDHQNNNVGGKKIYVKKVVGHYIGGGAGGYHGGGKGKGKHQGYQYYYKGGNQPANYGKGGNLYGNGKQQHQYQQQHGYHQKHHQHHQQHQKNYGHNQGKGKYHNHNHNHNQYNHHNQKGNIKLYEKKPVKKVTYAYVIQPVLQPIAIEEKHYGHGHGKGGYNQQQNYGKHHGKGGGYNNNNNHQHYGSKYHGGKGGGGGGNYQGGGHHYKNQNGGYHGGANNKYGGGGGGKGAPYGGSGSYGGGKGASYGGHNSFNGGKHGHNYGKLANVDMMHNKGGLSIAGLLGYTLLCVNYLLVLQQPTYNKYSGHYSKYSPHAGGKGEMVPVMSGGPIILASCGQVPSPPPNPHPPYPPPNKYLHHHHQHHKLPSEAVKTSVALEVSASSPQPLATNHTSSMNSSSKESLKSDELTPTTSLAPVQSYVRRLVIPVNENDRTIQVVRFNSGDGLPPPSRLRLPVSSSSSSVVDDDGSTRRRLVLSAGAIGGPSARLEISVDDRPQVVRTQNNLAELRRRPVDVGMRVVRRNRFNGSFRPVRLIDDDRDWILVAGRGVNQNGQMMTMIQADQPASGVSRQNGTKIVVVGNNSTLGQQNNTSLNQIADNNQILDLPDYALSGDSIELTCNHRMSNNRLYSVKWFKDSMEFYRFIPANGARAKSSLFLPDVRLDLSRSNSQTLYLRNVTHRSSGLYRCEVVSEGPNFETLTGEKRMQVYTLPQSGPQLSIVDRPETSSNPAPLFPLLQTMLPIFTQSRDTLALQWPSNAVQQQQQQQSLPVVDGPLVRCMSSRSNPAAQLRFFINNRPVDLSRTVENSTSSYSDGMETNVVSFKIVLSDFKLDQASATRGQVGGQRSSGGSGLDKGAASVKLDSKQTKQSPDQEKKENSSTTPKPTTNSSSTAVPANSSDDKAAKQIEYANANVHFDDHNLPVKLEEFKAALEAKRMKDNEIIDKQLNKRKQKPPPTSSQTEFNVDANGGHKEPEEHDEEGADSWLAPLPVRRDNENRKSAILLNTNNVIAQQTKANYDHQHHHHHHVGNGNNYQEEKINDGRIGREPEVALSSVNVALRASYSKQQQMEEARRRKARQTTTDSNEEGEQIYSNYIRIKCTSLMAPLSYEMTSELNVPLTLLVPASRLSDALTRQQMQLQQSGNSNSNSNKQDDDSIGRSIRNGGSLQAPRAVLIDRVAQGSAPPAKSSSPSANLNNTTRPNSSSSSSGGIKTSVNSSKINTNSSTALTQPPKPASSARQRASSSSASASSSSRDRALERSKHLDEMSKLRAKSASNGSASYLAALRSLLGIEGGYSRRQGEAFLKLDYFYLSSLVTGIVTSYQMTMTLAVATWLVANSRMLDIKDFRSLE